MDERTADYFGRVFVFRSLVAKRSRYNKTFYIKNNGFVLSVEPTDIRIVLVHEQTINSDHNVLCQGEASTGNTELTDCPTSVLLQTLYPEQHVSLSPLTAVPSILTAVPTPLSHQSSPLSPHCCPINPHRCPLTAVPSPLPHQSSPLSHHCCPTNPHRCPITAVPSATSNKVTGKRRLVFWCCSICRIS